MDGGFGRRIWRSERNVEKWRGGSREEEFIEWRVTRKMKKDEIK